MSSHRRDHFLETDPANPANLYCMASLVADEASRSGFREFARALEVALQSLLSAMPREEQSNALRLAYEAALKDHDAAPPRLRLVYSRD